MTERNTTAAIQRVNGATTILLPKNSNEEGATGWLQNVAGIEVPVFPGRQLTAKSEGRLFRRLRDPEIVDGVQRDEGDIGFLGLDKFKEWKPNGLSVEWVGDVPDCDFVLAAQTGSVSEIEARLAAGEAVSTVTSHATWLADIALEKNWNLSIREVSGATEAFGDLADMVADLRVSGESLRANGLREFHILDSVHLGLIYPGGTAGAVA